MAKSEDAALESARIAATAVRTWREISVRLSPIIGEDGFSLLYKRSLHLCSPRFPWLAGVPADAAFSDLEQALKSQTAVHSAEANAAIVSTFTGLLHTLIGEALTTRLLFECPRPLPDEDRDEHAQEVS